MQRVRFPSHFPRFTAFFLGVALLVSACGKTNEPTAPDEEKMNLGGASNAPPECDFGEDENKCSGEANQICSPLTVDSHHSCSTDKDCDFDELCFESGEENSCKSVVGMCSFHCGGDFDCASGEYCNPRDGQCQSRPSKGDDFGADCSEDDHCAGSCTQLHDGKAECEEHCRVGASSGCGEESLQGSGISCAFFAYDLDEFHLEQGVGDEGICAHLCNCNDDCPGNQLCLDAPTDGFKGICTGGIENDDALNCPNNMGGAGGMGGGTQ